MQKYQAVVRIDFEAEDDDIAKAHAAVLANRIGYPVEVLKPEETDDDN